MAVPVVGFQMASLSPLVPSIDEHHLLFTCVMPACPPDALGEPLFIKFRGRMGEDMGPFFPAGRVVPGGHHSAKEFVVRSRSLDRVQNHFAIIKDRALRVRDPLGIGRSQTSSQDRVGRKFELFSDYESFQRIDATANTSFCLHVRGG
jgi:hypothetical protein